MPVHSLADIDPAPVTYLVPNLIPRGKVTLLAGPSGSGKSLLALHLAAALSKAPRADTTNLPVTHQAPGDTFILCSDDDCRDTIAPRLERLGADRARIHIVASTEDFIFDSSKTVNRKPHRAIPRDKDGRAFRGRVHPEQYGHDEDEEPHFHRRNLNLTHIIDMNYLTDAIRGGLNPSLLIIDTIASFIGDKTVYSHKAMHVVMDYLTDLAQRFDIAILILCNTSQPTRRNQLPRVTGSAYITTHARAILTIQEDQIRVPRVPPRSAAGESIGVPPRSAWGETDTHPTSAAPADAAPPTHRLLTPAKTTGTHLPAPIPFTIQNGLLTFHPPRPPEPPRPTKTDQARDLLRSLLSAGPKFLRKEIQPAAEAHGITKNPLFEAANQLRLVRTPHPQPKGRDLYTWSLPAEPAPQPPPIAPHALPRESSPPSLLPDDRPSATLSHPRESNSIPKLNNQSPDT